MKYLHKVSFILLVIGGLNWLSLALFNWEIGNLFGGMDALISRVLYILIGLSAIYMIATHKKHCKDCGGENKSKPATPAAPAPGGNQPPGGNQQ